ncbi:MAG: DUF1343 domain-containing protein [Paludibacteraceae bacterium]|nr:DUF1343 domain-containing protein [Paludibacteraceae bacterium]
MSCFYKIVFLFSFLLGQWGLRAEVLTGIEVLKRSNYKLLEGKRVGLLTNPTGVDRDLNLTVDLLFQAPNVNLVALYAPEHGVRGDAYAGASIADTKDSKTGLPVYSLHGKVKKPTEAMLNGVDVVVYDIQDIGCRSYTFISSLGLLMQAAAEYGKEVVVLDRPNPLGGLKVEGPIVEKGFFSFVSQYAIPYVYGLTTGELATLINEENLNGNRCQLTVVKMQGWKRTMKFDETGLPWVLTSPHIPQVSSAIAYPMSGIVGELEALSIGVGYTLPFELFAAEWVNADSLSCALNALNLPGVKFRPITYKPFYKKGSGKLHRGVQVHIVDYEKVNLTEVQFYVLQELYALYPDKNPFLLGGLKSYRSFDSVCGSDQVRKLFTKRFRFADVEAFWRKDAESFREKSKKYWLY